MLRLAATFFLGLLVGLTATYDRTPKPDFEGYYDTYTLRVTGLDGYKFETKAVQNRDVRIDVKLHPDLEDLRRAGGDDGLAAYSLIWKDGSRCEVHIVDPEVWYRPEYFGHELTHCIFGEFHPQFTLNYMARPVTSDR